MSSGAVLSDRSIPRVATGALQCHVDEPFERILHSSTIAMVRTLIAE